MKRTMMFGCLWLMGVCSIGWAVEGEVLPASAPLGQLTGLADLNQYPPVCLEWKTLTVKEGLPNDHIYWVETDKLRKDRVWLGTDNGVVCYGIADGSIEVIQPKDGLGHQAVMSVAVDHLTGDVWAATFGGLSWISGGKVRRNFDQFNSGLPNNVVYCVITEGETVWTATTAGLGRYHYKTDEWEIFTSLNMPTDENWCYNLCQGGGRVYVAAWGGGIIEYTLETGRFQHYLDPDNEFEIDLFPHDGLVHNITTSPAFHDGLLWATTYFGMSVYNYRRWRGYFDHDSGLASNFINYARAQPGTHNGWICTDKGLSVLNYDTNRWVTYTPIDGHGPRGTVELWEGGERQKVFETESTIGHNFVLNVDFLDNTVWVGTSHGLSWAKLPQHISPVIQGE